jgi:hypothetical protein
MDYFDSILEEIEEQVEAFRELIDWSDRLSRKLGPKIEKIDTTDLAIRRAMRPYMDLSRNLGTRIISYEFVLTNQDDLVATFIFKAASAAGKFGAAAAAIKLD